MHLPAVPMTRHFDITILRIWLQSIVDFPTERAQPEGAHLFNGLLALGLVVPTLKVALGSELVLAIKDGNFPLAGLGDQTPHVFDAAAGLETRLQTRVEFTVGMEKLVEWINEQEYGFLSHCEQSWLIKVSLLVGYFRQ